MSDGGKTLKLESDLTKTFKVDYEGNVECTTVEIKENGNIYLEGCTVNGTEVDYTYGEKKESEPTTPQVTRYYSQTSGSIDGDLPSDAKTTVEELNSSYSVYLGLDVGGDNKVTAAYACFTRNGTEYCLKGYDIEAFNTNTDIIKDAFSDVLDNCSFSVDYSYGWDGGGLSADTSSTGWVYAYDGFQYCRVLESGSFNCSW